MAARRGRTIANMTHLFGGLSGGAAILTFFTAFGTIEKGDRVGDVNAGLVGDVEKPNRVGFVLSDRQGDR